MLLIASLTTIFAEPVFAGGTGGPSTPLARVRSLGLESERVGDVVVYFAARDRERARQLATLSDRAASYFAKDLGLALTVKVAALAPEQWFMDIPGIPYAIPWPSMPEQLIVMPSSLSEGLLIEGRDALADRRRVDFVQLHEHGHLLAKRYFRPESERDYLPVKWFEELLATCFAYSFVAATDPEWAGAARAEWRSRVAAFDPPVHSLDWSYMNALPGHEVARNYAWYQFVLNLRAAELHDRYGNDFLRRLRSGLPWEKGATWSTSSILALLEPIAPGFGDWASRVERPGPATTAEN